MLAWEQRATARTCGRNSLQAMQTPGHVNASRLLPCCSVHAPAAVDSELPYELRALEAALFAAAKVLENETIALEAKALPSLASLTQKVRAACLRMP